MDSLSCFALVQMLTIFIFLLVSPSECSLNIFDYAKKQFNHCFSFQINVKVFFYHQPPVHSDEIIIIIDHHFSDDEGHI